LCDRHQGEWVGIMNVPHLQLGISDAALMAPGIVDTPMHANDPDEFLKGLSPMGMISDVDDIVEAIVYLTEARHVTGEVLHVDAGAHNGKW
jgi:NAD(P)-dependent dehydrogenase (short-subunit alcohol dehydrogenase family)